MTRTCRFCRSEKNRTFVDLGTSPLANSYIRPDQLSDLEPFFALHPFVCEECYLVQLEAFETPENIFGDYAYFSSFSDTWLEHCRTYAATISRRLGLNESSLVVEVASNDGYLLQYFKQAGIPVLGVEPAVNVARAAEESGIRTLVDFFGVRLAEEMRKNGRRADLLIGNNVLAHVPDINDFVAGLKLALKPQGVLTMEFPHLLELMAHNQFDTIYHEHFSYLSFYTVMEIFRRHGLTVFDVDLLPTHGGSLRVYARNTEDDSKGVTRAAEDLLKRELDAGINRMDTYLDFSERVQAVKRNLLRFLIQAREDGKQVVGYGAPAKACTLLNYCGVGTDLLPYTVDRSPHKQGLYLPGRRIPIESPDKIRETRPEYVLILPWNIKEEIMAHMSDVRDWGGRFVVPIPDVEVL